MKRTNWTKEEIDLLKYLYEDKGLSYDEIYLYFKNNGNDRSRNSIHIKITRCKFKHTKNQTIEIKRKNVSGDRNPMFGKDSPNKGLNKKNSERIKYSAIKISKTRKKMFLDGLLRDISGNKNPMFGKIPWSFGLTKDTDIRLANVAKISSESGKKAWSLKTEEEKKIVIDRLNKAMMNQHKATKIEIKISEYLESENIEFIKNMKINYFYVDFYLPLYNIVLECDGDYWHSNPKFYKNKNLTDVQIKNLDRDKRKNKMLEDNKIKYLRFWEYDIHNNFDKVKYEIKELLNKKKVLN